MNSKPPECFLKLDDAKLLAICIYGEARGEKMEGKIAVANVIMNRVKAATWMGKTIEGVILKPKQFSCFNEGDPNRLGLMAIAAQWDKAFGKNKHLRDCCYIAEGVISGDIRDNTDGATHYKTITCHASWAASMQLTDTIGNHEFYK